MYDLFHIPVALKQIPLIVMVLSLVGISKPSFLKGWAIINGNSVYIMLL